MGWNYSSIPKLQRSNRRKLGIGYKWFHHTLDQACDSISMLRLKLNHVGNYCFNSNFTKNCSEYSHLICQHWLRYWLGTAVVTRHQCCPCQCLTHMCVTRSRCHAWYTLVNHGHGFNIAPPHCNCNGGGGGGGGGISITRRCWVGKSWKLWVLLIYLLL